MDLTYDIGNYMNHYLMIFISILGNRLFTLDDQDVEFYLPQLVNMYVQHHEVAEVVHPYIVHRCR